MVGQSRPFFAPVAAVISLGLSRGQPRRRAVEISLGVVLGIAVADGLVRVIGTGTLQIVLVVILAMAAALLVGAGTLLVNQAVISAIFVVTLPTTGQGTVFDRFFDAAIGGVVALVLSQVLFPRDPVRQVGAGGRQGAGRAGRGARRRCRVGLAEGNQDEAERALTRVRSLNDEITAFYDAIAVGRENAWVSPARRRRALGHLRAYSDAARQVDYAVRNTRILAREAVLAIRNGPADPELAEARVDPGRRRARAQRGAGRARAGLRDALPGAPGRRHRGRAAAHRPRGQAQAVRGRRELRRRRRARRRPRPPRTRVGRA